NIAAKLAPLNEMWDEFEKLTRFAEKSPAAPDQKPQPVVLHDRSSFLRWIPSLLGSLLEIAAQIFLVAVLTLFILLQRENLGDRLIRVVGRRHLSSTTKAMSDAAARVSRYLLLQVSTNAAIGVGVTLGLAAIGMEYPLLWGVLAMAFRFIPYAGIWLAAA